MSSIRVLLTGGGSGGHVYPLFAVARGFRELALERKLDLELWYLGPKSEFSQPLIAEGMRVRFIAGAKLRRYASLQNILDVPKFFTGLLQALVKIFFIMPDAVFSKGGPGAFPVILAARFYRIPVVIHESDTFPGPTNALSSRFATRIGVSFPSTARYFHPEKVFVSGAPIREELLHDIPEQRAAKESLGFDPARPLVLVLGGSQGSQRINEFILTNIAQLSRETQVLHQTGRANYETVSKLAEAARTDLQVSDPKTTPYRVVAYLDEELRSALAAADIIIGRAGSSAIFEAAAFGKPCILIPLPESAHDHQRTNAYAFAEAGGGVVLEERNFLPGILVAKVHDILTREDLRGRMQAASRAFFKPDAHKTLAQETFQLIRRIS